jgi:hypothetical protein
VSDPPCRAVSAARSHPHVPRRERIGSRSFCRCCLLGAITGSGSRRFRLHRFAGLENLRQAVLAALQLLGEITAQLSLAVLAVLLRIQDLGLPHQLLDLLLQLGLGFEHPFMTHLFVFGGIGLHLGAIESY